MIVFCRLLGRGKMEANQVRLLGDAGEDDDHHRIVIVKTPKLPGKDIAEMQKL